MEAAAGCTQIILTLLWHKPEIIMLLFLTARNFQFLHKKLLDDHKDRRGYSHSKEEALDRTMWRNRFGGGFGLAVRQNTE